MVARIDHGMIDPADQPRRVFQMSATPDSTFTTLEQLIADLQLKLAEREAERDEARGERDKAQRRLAERTAERDEAVAQQTATAEVLQVINSSPGDHAPVFDAILEKARERTDAIHGDLWTYDGECFHLAATHGEPGMSGWLRQQGSLRPWPGSRLEDLLKGEDYVQLDDALESSSIQLAPEFLEQHKIAGIRTILSVPLRKEGVVLGLITVYRREVRPFTDRQIALLQNFAAQAVIAMENARLLTETREALEQQTATAEVLQVINSSPGDLAPVFDAILEKARAVCGFAHGSLNVYDGEYFRTVAMHGYPEAFAELLRQPRRTGPQARFLEGDRIVHITDVAAEEPASDDPVYRAAIAAGVRTVLFVPLRNDRNLLGYLTANRREARPFSEKEIALLENFAAQAVIAMENARLITETREALEQQTATAEVLQVINSSPGDLAPVFDAMLEKAIRLCEAAFGSLWTYDCECFNAVAVRNVPPSLAEFVRQPHTAGPNTPLGRVVRTKHLVSIEDLATDEMYRSGDRWTAAPVELGGARSYLAIPLVRDEALVGAFAVARHEVRPFTDKQIALLQNFAAQAVIAMENARLLTETREALEQQTATAEILRVIAGSTANAQPAFDAIAAAAIRLTGASLSGVAIYDGKLMHLAAMSGVTPEEDENIRAVFPIPADDSTATGRAILTRQVTHIEQMPASSEHPYPRLARSSGQTVLAVPMLRDGIPVGAINVQRRQAEPFTDKQIDLFKSFADQAVIAMENARLLTETREALQQQMATAEVLQVINSSPGDPVPAFDAMLEKAMNLCEAAFGILFIYAGEGIRAVATRGLSTQLDDFVRAGFPVNPDSEMSRGVEIQHIADLTQIQLTNRPALSAAVELGSARTMLNVALRKNGGRLGFFSIFRHEVRPFTERQVELFRNFAAQAVIAIENARLLEELRWRTKEVSELNRGLEARVADQVDELGRVGRLKRFLAPQLAELIVSQGDEQILESHRREIVVVFCDLRGYTAFTETAEPEEVLEFLREYHGALGPLVSQYEGTLDQFSGDGIMVFFNDPVPCPDPAERAVKMAMAMREEAGKLIVTWRRDGCELGFGAGIAQGYATLGQIGFSERSGYTAIGTVCNLAARLCAQAKDGQILISSRVARAVEAVARLEDLGNLELKGLRRPVAAFNVVQSTSPAEARPNLTIVAKSQGA
jgi:GAF domain-containing protein